MSSKNPVQRLHEILDNIDAVEVFIASLDFQSFAADRKTVYAVTRALEIISEATRRLPDELKDGHPGVDWPAIAAVDSLHALRGVALAELQRAVSEP